jgi:hypothetical protein
MTVEQVDVEVGVERIVVDDEVAENPYTEAAYVVQQDGEIIGVKENPHCRLGTEPREVGVVFFRDQDLADTRVIGHELLLLLIWADANFMPEA